MKHFLLTRWNLPEAIRPGMAATLADPEWSAYRRDLLLNFCLPSVAQQTFEDFEWLFLLFAGTPDADWFESLDPRLRVVWVENPDSSGGPEARDIVRSESGGDWVVTTRLDSDDLLHPNYMRRVQATHDKRTHFVEFTYGYYYDVRSREMRLLYEPHNAFTTFIEPGGESAQTIWDWEHNQISRGARPIASFDEPGWMATVHSKNTSTRLLGEEMTSLERDKVLREFGVA